jgi:hypothetical protein
MEALGVSYNFAFAPFAHYLPPLESQDSSVCIGTGYGLEGWDSIPETGVRIFSTLQHPDQYWSPPSLISNGYRRLFLGGKAAGK